MRSIGRPYGSSAQVFVRLSVGAAAILGAVTLFGCGKPFNVKPRTALPVANYTAAASTARVEVRAVPVIDEDLLYETFDANLIIAGVLPVRVMLKNSSDESIVLKKARFEIRGAHGRAVRAVNPREAFKRVVSYYEISTYNKSGYKESLTDFVSHSLDGLEPLGPRQSREGLLFFLIPPEMSRGPGLTLRITLFDSAQSPIELKLS